MSEAEIKDLVWRVAVESSNNGAGWSQESVVLREVRERMGGARKDLKLQQVVLEAWHDLFTEKKLGWGYDLDNPNSPFYHVR